MDSKYYILYDMYTKQLIWFEHVILKNEDIAYELMDFNKKKEERKMEQCGNRELRKQ